MKVLYTQRLMNTLRDMFNGFSLLPALLRYPTPLLAGLPLEEAKYICQDGLIDPSYPSTCASTASAWGSQKAMSMARYSSMAIDSAARACSRRPAVAYSVPRP
jgi:hypothetical protein